LDAILPSTLVLRSFKCCPVRLLFPFTSCLFHVLTSPRRNLSSDDILGLRTTAQCNPMSSSPSAPSYTAAPGSFLAPAARNHVPMAPSQALALPNCTVIVGLLGGGCGGYTVSMQDRVTGRRSGITLDRSCLPLWRRIYSHSKYSS
jgi:hypothetical protein